ncbi:hypothetical protein B9G98_01014 [Wickerhamiella sorbophila]|uniref:Uncharacterized protein n=1 Tax=Wickerhamiella sorbophila TaxID=45607 RepID=A0A2T0FEI3_9ASCO|nr:hypothetical protein B9G98_01014 [Wickerhamiella sorbophila]PRT53394.1 hypothetical protein B9G98_01014 [Wickerhamiella sorbophila]
MVRLSLFTLISYSAIGVFANATDLDTTLVSTSSTPCASVVTTVVFSQPTFCSCPNDGTLDALVQAEKGAKDSVDKIVLILQSANVNLSSVHEALVVLEDSMTGLANLVNGAACIGPDFVNVFSNIVQAIATCAGLIFDLATVNVLGSIEQIFELVKSVGNSVSAIVHGIKAIIENKDLLVCFGCQEVNALNNMLLVLEDVAKKIIPGFKLPQLPSCSGPTTTVLTVSGGCSAAPAPTISDTIGGSRQCTRIYTVSAPPLDPTLCPCSEDQTLNGVITDIQNVINFAKAILSILPPLPGVLGSLSSKVLPELVDSLIRFLNVLFGAGCLGSFAGPLLSALKDLLIRILSLVKLLQQVSQNPSGAVDTIVSVLTAVLKMFNSLTDQLFAVIESKSMKCFACSDINSLNSLISSVNEELSRLPVVSGIQISLFPSCDSSASILTNIVPCTVSA